MRYAHCWLKLGGEVERLVEENRHVFGESAAFGGGWPAEAGQSMRARRSD